jgi:hypothetical protein
MLKEVTAPGGLPACLGLINKTCTIVTLVEADPLDQLRPHPAGT